MSDDQTQTGESEPFDQTNGLATGLEGDDQGTLGDGERDEEETGGVLGEAYRGIADPVNGLGVDDDDDGRSAEDADEAVTPYSEETDR